MVFKEYYAHLGKIPENSSFYDDDENFCYNQLKKGVSHITVQGVSKNGNPTLACHCALITGCMFFCVILSKTGQI